MEITSKMKKSFFARLFLVVALSLPFSGQALASKNNPDLRKRGWLSTLQGTIKGTAIFGGAAFGICLLRGGVPEVWKNLSLCLIAGLFGGALGYDKAQRNNSDNNLLDKQNKIESDVGEVKAELGGIDRKFNEMSGNLNGIIERLTNFLNN